MTPGLSPCYNKMLVAKCRVPDREFKCRIGEGFTYSWKTERKKKKKQNRRQSGTPQEINTINIEVNYRR